jgi:hypothetical protein
MYMATDERQSGAKQTVCAPSKVLTLSLSHHLTSAFLSYVQELEARLLHMESVFTQLTQQLGQTPNGESALSGPCISEESKAAAAALLRSIINKGQTAQPQPPDNPPTPDSSSSVKIEDDVVDSLGQLTLDEHGHMRWIGGSSTMSLIQSFRAAAAAPHSRGSPMADDSGQPNKLYFPAAVFFGKVRALPGPEEVEYPERDLADKLVSFLLVCLGSPVHSALGCCIFLAFPLLVARHR